MILRVESRRAVRAAKKRGRAIKLGHEAKNLQMAIDAQLDTLGICSLIRS